MLNSDLMLALQALLNSHMGLAPLTPEAALPHWQQVAKALQDAHAARRNLSLGQQARAAKRAELGLSGTGGRPPSVLYDVAMDGLWERQAMGIASALEIVAAALAENPGNGDAPTQGSVAVQMSKKGMWWRHVVTDNGEFDLYVRRARVQPLENVAPAEPEPAPEIQPQRKNRAKK